MAFKKFDEAKWIFDDYDLVIDQRAVQKKDFTTGEDYDGYTWNPSDEDSVLQTTMNKYVMRRKKKTMTMFKTYDAKYFKASDLTKYEDTGFMVPPPAALPYDKDLHNGQFAEFTNNWFLISSKAKFTKNQGVTMTITFTRTFNWELELVNKV